ncbi:MAG: DNA-binding response regulator [Candidatus Rokubacteria bacterium GWA2_70_23]|nr:MAG: DNA-binding response regulator [Candidatus Rokubacteria bacterium GWA2_70_23]
MEKIRVLLADDHTLFREGVRMLLEAQGDFDVVGEAATAEEAIEQAVRASPDVVALDISMPGDGLEATRRLRRELPALKVLILTMHGSDDYFFQALEAGASGYLVKDSAPADLVAALKEVAAGRVFLHASMAARLVRAFLQVTGRGEEAPRLARLTEREKEVLALIAEGHTSEEIAERLHRSVHTIHSHRAHIVEKLGLHSRAELMRYAVLLGLRR